MIKKIWKKYSFTVLLIFMIIGIFDPRLALLAIICMSGPIIMAFYNGRYWCGNICPRGSFYDTVMNRIVKKKRPVPKLLKSTFFRILVILIMFTIFGLGIKSNWGDVSGIGMVFYRMIVATTIIGIIFSYIYTPRTWCTFCPMGSLASFVSYTRDHL